MVPFVVGVVSTAVPRPGAGVRHRASHSTGVTAFRTMALSGADQDIGYA